MAGGGQKAIEQIKAGDLVLAADPLGGSSTAKAVTGTVSHGGLLQIVDVTVDTDGDRGSGTATVSANANHPFWESGQRTWLAAGQLRAGMTLQDEDGDPIQVEKIGRRFEQEQVYNLTVNDVSTYFVLAGDQPLLVHNCGSLNDNGIGGAHPRDHLDKDDDFIKNRANDPENLRKERPEWASTLKVEDPQALIDEIVNANGKTIQNWLRNDNRPENLELKKSFNYVVGRYAKPDGSDPADGKTLTVVLKKYKVKPKHSGGYLLYTLKVS